MTLARILFTTWVCVLWRRVSCATVRVEFLTSVLRWMEGSWFDRLTTNVNIKVR